MVRKQRLWTAAALLSGLLAPMATVATPVTLEITDVTFNAHAGYGIDGSETSSPTLLDVRFSTSAFVDQSFVLDLPNPHSRTFLFGTVTFAEPNAGGGIDSAETNDLGVTATFVFNSPEGASKQLTAVGVATTGSVSDAFVDYTLTWNSVLVDFGVDGRFRINLEDLTFSGIESKDLYATVTLERVPASPTSGPVPPTNGAAVPEPATLALLGLGLAGLGFSRRRSRD